MGDGPGATTYVMINGFLIDCSIRENHSFDSDVTEYPVESGGKITDNILPRPIVIEMEGLVTNSPIGPIATTRTTQGAELRLTETKPAEMMYEFLMRLRNERKPFPIQTSLRTYNNMAMKSLNIPKGDHLDDIKFTATFQQIQSIENKRTVRVSTPIGKGGGGGKKTVTKPGTPWPGRTILIDKQLRAWFDPDVENVYGVPVGGWRYFAEFTDRVPNAPDVGTTSYFSQKKWSLYRMAILPYNKTLFTGGPVSLSAPATQEDLEDEASSAWKRVVAVNLSQCRLNGFTIKTPPGGIVQPEYKPPNGALRGRTT